MNIREFGKSDWKQLWPILQQVFGAGESYPYPADTSEDEARRLWIDLPTTTCVAEDEKGTLLGSYYIKPNQPGRGAHVCNCGYLVAESARGHGVASAMCEHSQQLARRLGFRAMQFNLVVSTNVVALRLWQQQGFAVVGHLPGAFNSAAHGYVDALVMYKQLT